MGELNLTPAELEAKKFMLHIVNNAILKPCDIGEGGNISATLPVWYDKEKFKRGQNYFFDNRIGILTSNLCGLFTLLADPKGLNVLHSTGRSSTPETAKKRYISTIIHTVSWYEIDLHPGSKSWASLNRVRKMHLNASNSATEKKLGFISQAEVALTTFGFMGFALIRPHLLGIRYDNKEDREGFIYFWAVMGHMLGVEDEFNMCLFGIETVEQICLIMLRYVFMPLIQLESPKFKHMVTALLEGLSPFFPNMTYGLQMFIVKRLIGVPGYQYDVDLSKEKICRHIFSADEMVAARKLIKSLREETNVDLKVEDILFTDGVPLLVQKETFAVSNKEANSHGTMKDDSQKCIKLNFDEDSLEVGDKKCFFVMHSNDNVDWKSYLNDSKFYSLSKTDRFVVRSRCFILKMYENVVGRYFCEKGLSAFLYILRRYHESTKRKSCNK